MKATNEHTLLPGMVENYEDSDGTMISHSLPSDTDNTLSSNLGTMVINSDGEDEEDSTMKRNSIHSFTLHTSFVKKHLHGNLEVTTLLRWTWARNPIVLTSWTTLKRKMAGRQVEEVIRMVTRIRIRLQPPFSTLVRFGSVSFGCSSSIAWIRLIFIFNHRFHFQ